MEEVESGGDRGGRTAVGDVPNLACHLISSFAAIRIEAVWAKKDMICSPRAKKDMICSLLLCEMRLDAAAVVVVVAGCHGSVHFDGSLKLTTCLL